jgi:hypothetical protein
VKYVLLNSYSQEEDKTGVLYLLVQWLHSATSALYLQVKFVLLNSYSQEEDKTGLL